MSAEVVSPYSIQAKHQSLPPVLEKQTKRKNNNLAKTKVQNKEGEIRKWLANRQIGVKHPRTATSMERNPQSRQDKKPRTQSNWKHRAPDDPQYQNQQVLSGGFKEFRPTDAFEEPFTPTSASKPPSMAYNSAPFSPFASIPISGKDIAHNRREINNLQRWLDQKEIQFLNVEYQHKHEGILGENSPRSPASQNFGSNVSETNYSVRLGQKVKTPPGAHAFVLTDARGIQSQRLETQTQDYNTDRMSYKFENVKKKKITDGQMLSSLAEQDSIYAYCLEQVIRVIEPSSDDLAKLLLRCALGISQNFQRVMGFHRKICDGFNAKVLSQKQVIDRLYKLTGQLENRPKSGEKMNFATQKVIDQAKSYEEKGKKLEQDLERLKEALEKMLTQDPSGVSEDLDDIYEELNENANSRFGQLMSGLNPNSFPPEGESEKFILEKLKNTSQDTVLRLSKILFRNDKFKDQDTQTYKEMSDQYMLEMKLKQQDQLISEQLHKITDLEARIKTKNQKLASLMKENKDIVDNKKEAGSTLQEARIEIKALNQKIESLHNEIDSSEKRIKAERKKAIQAQEITKKAVESAKAADHRLEQMKETLKDFQMKYVEKTNYIQKERSIDSLKPSFKLDVLPPADDVASFELDQAFKRHTNIDDLLQSQMGTERSSISSKLSQIEASVSKEFQNKREEKLKIEEEIREKKKLENKKKEEEKAKIKEKAAVLDPALQKQLEAMQKLKLDMASSKAQAEKKSQQAQKIKQKEKQKQETVAQVMSSREEKKIEEMPSVTPSGLGMATDDSDANLSMTLTTPAPPRVEMPTPISEKESRTSGRKAESRVSFESKEPRTIHKKTPSPRPIPPTGGGPKELEMISRKFKNSPRISSFAKGRKHYSVLTGEEEEQDELMIEQAEEGDDASTQKGHQLTMGSGGRRATMGDEDNSQFSFVSEEDSDTENVGRKKSRKKRKSIVSKRSMGSQVIEEDQDKVDEDEFENTKKFGKKKGMSQSEFDSVLEDSGYIHNGESIEERFEITADGRRISRKFRKSRLGKQSRASTHCSTQTTQTELTLPILEHLLANLPHHIYCEFVKPPLSKQDEARIAQLYKIQKERQDLFMKFGYRIKGGSFHSEQPFNRTFTSGYHPEEPDFGDRRLPRDVPTCLVKFNNGGGNMASLLSKKDKTKKKTLQHIKIRPQPQHFIPKGVADITTAGEAGNEVLLRTSLESYGIDIKK